jgi:hypothetical protein
VQCGLRVYGVDHDGGLPLDLLKGLQRRVQRQPCQLGHHGEDLSHLKQDSEAKPHKLLQEQKARSYSVARGSNDAGG